MTHVRIDVVTGVAALHTNGQRFDAVAGGQDLLFKRLVGIGYVQIATPKQPT